METKLKLTISRSDIARLHAHPLLQEMGHAPPVERALTDVYYDTDDLALWRSGITLRVREEGGSWVQTVTSGGASSQGLHRRGKWASVLSDSAPQPAVIAREIKRDRIATLLASETVVSGLRPVFTNKMHRTAWHLELPDGQRVACALDTGNLHCAGETVAIDELTFKLENGNPALLFELVLALHEDVTLHIARDSKTSRGVALIDNSPIPPVKAIPVRLSNKTRLDDALQRMGLNCLRQMQANVPGVLRQSPESLHQMRVGLRRLRALLDMFAELAPAPQDIREGLTWLADELGTTRDWDVLAGKTLASIAGLDSAPLRTAAQDKATMLHQQLLLALRDPRYTTLLLQLNGWLHGRHWHWAEAGRGATLSKRASNGMAPLLHKAVRRLSKRLDRLDRSDPADRHRMRIAAKKARYAAEFFTDLLPAKSVKRYVSSLSRLQDQLGNLNDLAVADRLLTQLNGAVTGDAAAYARGYISAVAATELPQLRKSLDAVARLKMPA